MPKRFWILGRSVDSRILAIIAATLFADAVSGIGFWIFKFLRDPSNFYGALFIAFAGGAFYFTIVGLIVAFVSLEQPENASFDQRARILFKKAHGKHIDYIVDRMKHIFEHYSESVEIRYEFLSYDEQDAKFRMESTNTTKIMGYIDDIQAQLDTDFAIYDVATPPANQIGNQLHWFTVDGFTIANGREFQGTEIKIPFRATIDRDRPCTICYKVAYWVSGDLEETDYTPKRYTQRIVASVQNSTVPGRSINIRLLNPADKSEIDHFELKPGQKIDILDKKDVLPGEKALVFKVECQK